jgi:hypothetical protein
LGRRRHAIGDGGEQPGNGLAHQRRALRVLGGEEIGAPGIGKARMDMEAAAGAPAIGLGHEGGEQAMLGGDAAHQPLPLDGLIGCAHGIGAVAQYNLELAGRIFGDQGFGRQAHGPGRGIELGDEGAELLQLDHA